MSVATEISRLQGLKNTLRAKLVSMLGIPGTADLEDCVNAVEDIADKGAISGSIADKSEAYSVPAGYHNGLGTVGIATAEQSKIIPGNIKSGVTVMGVTGSYAGEAVRLQEKSITPTKAAQNVTPDSGYDGLSKVGVAAIPDAYQDISGVTATAGDVLANKIFVAANGTETAGTMANNGAVNASIDGLTVASYTIPQGYHNGAGKVLLTNDIEAALAAI